MARCDSPGWPQQEPGSCGIGFDINCGMRRVLTSLTLDAVVLASVQAGLSRPVVRFTPIGNVKG